MYMCGKLHLLPVLNPCLCDLGHVAWSGKSYWKRTNNYIKLGLLPLFVAGAGSLSFGKNFMRERMKWKRQQMNIIWKKKKERKLWSKTREDQRGKFFCQNSKKSVLHSILGTASLFQRFLLIKWKRSYIASIGSRICIHMIHINIGIS